MTDETSGLRCYDCSKLTTGRPPYDSFDECSDCGSDNTVKVTITACPNWPGECNDEAHHYGLARTSAMCHETEEEA